MPDASMSEQPFEVHDPDILAQARSVLDACQSGKAMQDAVLASVKRTSRALIVHEAQLTAGFGAEVAARLADAAFPWLDAPIRRVTYPDRPVPYAKSLEKVLLPDKGKVVRAARELMGF